ncbi:MAG: sulfite exporter TauE/SafE family protein [Pseudomonadota bacterium]|nr:sulfite exporter TauE/SafE family protein [Pseudomonadota bacterium]
MTAAHVASIVLVFFLAGLVKGVVGLGLPTLSMALLALWMAPAQAAALLIVPSLVTNLWQLKPWGALGPVFKRIAPMQVGIVIGTLAGAWALGAPSGTWASMALGIALIAYALWTLAGIHLAVNPGTERWLGPVIGALTGAISSATGVFVIPAVPYLQALGLTRDELMQAMGISFTVATLALAATLSVSAHYSAATLVTSALALLPALVGMAAGERLRKVLSPLLFKRIFMGALLLLGAQMVARACM